MAFKNKIRLDTMNDIQTFVNIISRTDAVVHLQDGQNFCVSARSILGAIAAMEWTDIYCISDVDISGKISDFII